MAARGRGKTRGAKGLAAAAFLVTLAACGGSSNPSPTTSSAPSASTSVTSSPSESPTPSDSSPTTSGSPSESPSPTPTSSTEFGSAPVTGGHSPDAPAQSRLQRIAVGSHTGFDRLVLDFGTDPVPDFTVTPQDTSAFRMDPSDTLVTLDGDSGVRVVVQSTVLMPSAIIDDLRPRFPAIREVQQIGNFEAYVSYGVGVSGTSMIRVLTLTSPNRLVVDVAWPDPA